MNVSTLILVVVLPLLIIAVALTAIRMLRGPTLPDRVIALDLLATIGIGCIAACAIAFDQPAILDVATVIALIAFLGTIAFAYYMERR